MDAGRFFLGVDGGQSSTRAVLGDAFGKILCRVAGGPCNHAAPGLGEARFREVISALLAEVLQVSGLDSGVEFDAVCFAMSGGPDDKRAILSELTQASAIEVTTDAEAALDGAAGGGPGIVVIAGTGSMALARDSAGRVARCGGWGYVFGDEGGAFDVVRRAVRLALAAEEGWGEPTRLREILLEATGSASANEALHRFYRPEWSRDRVARIAVRIDRLAEDGDRSACAILDECGQLLGSLGLRAARSLPGGGAGLKAFPSGGVYASRFVRDAFESRVQGAGVAVGRPMHDAALGALLRAYRLRGLRVPVTED